MARRSRNSPNSDNRLRKWCPIMQSHKLFRGGVPRFPAPDHGDGRDLESQADEIREKPSIGSSSLGSPAGSSRPGQFPDKSFHSFGNNNFSSKYGMTRQKGGNLAPLFT